MRKMLLVEEAKEARFLEGSSSQIIVVWGHREVESRVKILRKDFNREAGKCAISSA